MILYFDTSALVKLLIAEDGSDLAAELWATGLPAATGVLAYPEARAALAAADRSGRLTARAHGRARTGLEQLVRELVLIGIDEQLAREAGQLADDHGLRGCDAVHLASALAAGDAVTVVSWDADLRRAALACALGVAPPA